MKDRSYGGYQILYVEEEVKQLAFRKLATLAGVEGADDVFLNKGEELWKDR